MTIAAYEAFHACGWQNTQACILSLQEAYLKIKKEDDADNLKDDNHDGIADVEEMGPDALVKRKTALWIRAADPDKISSAAGSLYTAWLGVLATLKVQFAKTVALGFAIGNAMRPLAAKWVAPALAQVLPEEYVEESCVSIVLHPVYTLYTPLLPYMHLYAPAIHVYTPYIHL